MNDIMENLAKDLDAMVTCTICMERYDSPMALPCLHTFCEKCIRGHFQACRQNDNGLYACPVCRKPANNQHTNLSMTQALSKLTLNHMVSELQCVLNAYEENLGFLPRCINHSEPCTRYRCSDHDLRLCPECLFEHRLCNVSQNVTEDSNLPKKCSITAEGKNNVESEKYSLKLSLREVPSREKKPRNHAGTSPSSGGLSRMTFNVRNLQGGYPDDGCCRISGMAVLDNGRLLLVDCMNNSIKLMDTESTECKVLNKFSSSPCGIAVCGQHVAVTFPQNCQIHIFITTANYENLVKIQTIQCTSACYGIASFKDRFVFCSSTYLTFLHKDVNTGFGKEHKFQPFRVTFRDGKIECPESVVFDSIGQSVFVTDTKKHSVSHISVDGNILWTRWSRRLKEPTALIYLHGNVLVAFKNSMALLSETGRLISQNIFQSEDVSEALSLARDGNRLYVGYKINSPNRNKVMVVDLKGRRELQSTRL